MRLGTAVATGVVQGVTEALPISSSAHLALLREVLPSELSPSARKAIDVAVHVGSLAGPLLVLKQRGLDVRSLLAAGLASLPSAVVGGTARRQIESRLGSPQQVAALGAAAAAAVWLIDRRSGDGHAARPERVPVRDLLTIGTAQAAALVPGVSRSGITYAAARARGLDRSSAADLSIAMAVPVIAGASVLMLATERDTLAANADLLAPAIAAAAAASVAMAPASRPALMRGTGAFAAYRGALGALVLRRRRGQQHP